MQQRMIFYFIIKQRTFLYLTVLHCSSSHNEEGWTVIPTAEAQTIWGQTTKGQTSKTRDYTKTWKKVADCNVNYLYFGDMSLLSVSFVTIDRHHGFFLHVNEADSYYTRWQNHLSEKQRFLLASYSETGRYIVGFGLVDMAISTNPKPTIYFSIATCTRIRALQSRPT